MQNFKRISRLLSVAALLIALQGVQQVSAQSLQDNSLRANYLIRFIDFVRWDRPLNQPITIAVIGSRPLASALEDVADEKRSKGRDFAIVEIAATDKLEGIDLLFISEGYQDEWTDLIARAREQSVVTVSDQSEFLEAGGLIEFTVSKNRLRFTLNVEGAEHYRVGLSSKLIQLSVRK